MTRRSFGIRWIILAAVGGALATVGIAALLTNIFQHQQEARNPFYRVVTLTDTTEDPAVWGKNFPLQYDDYRKTVDQVRTRYGGSEGQPRFAQRRVRSDDAPARAVPALVVGAIVLFGSVDLARCRTLFSRGHDLTSFGRPAK